MQREQGEVADSGHVIRRLVEWAENNDLIRAVFLEGSRANPNRTPDRFSDYDVAIVVSDPRPFVDGASWETWFGEPVMHWSDQQFDEGIERRMRLVVYEDGTRIDYVIWTGSAFAAVKRLPRLPDILDSGYSVLLAKDGLTADLHAPSYRADVPQRPKEDEFERFLDDFWLDVAYTAKNLARRELLPSKFGFSLLSLNHLRRLLEWRSAIDSAWSDPTGRHGRGLQASVPEDRWRRLELTFAGADPAGNWEALWTALDLHGELAAEIAGLLGFRYPREREGRAIAYLRALADSRMA